MSGVRHTRYTFGTARAWNALRGRLVGARKNILPEDFQIVCARDGKLVKVTIPRGTEVAFFSQPKVKSGERPKVTVAMTFYAPDLQVSVKSDGSVWILDLDKPGNGYRRRPALTHGRLPGRR